MFTYLYRYVLPIPSGATSVTLPNAPGVIVAAITLAADPAASTVAATPLFDSFDPLAVPMVPGYVAPEPAPQEPEVEGAGQDDLSTLPAGSNGCAGCVSGSVPPVVGGDLLTLLLFLVFLALRLGTPVAQRGRML
ncbi:MAG: hypothetical protein FJ109_20885 [Deltaproteobacteria bacterium]|nr:hypothetical protein [Deltaproteobacteria bacterium]